MVLITLEDGITDMDPNKGNNRANKTSDGFDSESLKQCPTSWGNEVAN